MAYGIEHFLGVDLDYVGGLPYWDQGRAAPSPKPGTKAMGDDGHAYVLVQASAGIAANTAVIITEPAFTAAGGGGSYSTQGTAVTSGQYFWARSNAL